MESAFLTPSQLAQLRAMGQRPEEQIEDKTPPLRPANMYRCYVCSRATAGVISNAGIPLCNHCYDIHCVTHCVTHY